MNRIAGLAALVVATVLWANSSAVAWTPPIGIPMPPFGINEVARPTPAPWTTPTAGFYYVNEATGNDTGNAYGTPALPRRTIPNPVPAGSVVEVHGTYTQRLTSPRSLRLNGTISAPIFVRGVNASTKPVFTNYIELVGSYFVLENIEFAMAFSDAGKYQIGWLDGDHGVLRNSDVHGNQSAGAMALQGFIFTQTPVSYMVIYNNVIHDNGDWANYTIIQKIHGISVGANVDHLWIVDNEIYHNAGDGIQFGAGQNNNAILHHVYIGRNHSHHNKDTGMWAKEASDVVFSQNNVHDHRPGNEAFGACLGFQYNPERVWFLFNDVHDCDFGIALGSDEIDLVTSSYFIGNVIYRIHNSGGYLNNAAISLPGSRNRFVVNNTMYDIDSGIQVPSSAGNVDIENNVIAGVTLSQGRHIQVDVPTVANASTMKYNLLDSPAKIVWGGAGPYTSAGFKTAFRTQGLGTVEASPLFVDAASYKLRLQAGSPAIDAGITAAVYLTFLNLYGIDIAKDATGVARPQGTAYDMGAYEFGSASAGVPLAPSGLIVK